MPATGQPPIGVTVLTGYLGSGKTTLLKGLLAHPDLSDTAVIVNEFGEVGLDHLLVEQGSEDTVLLDAGCLCCTISDSLADTLGDLIFRRARGEIPPFRRVVVETTGLADPGPILHALLTDRMVTDHYVLDGLVAVVDAVHGLDQLDREPEALKQAAMADRIVVSKTDLAPPDAVARLTARLTDINPRAARLTPVQGRIGDPGDLIDLRAARGLDPAELARIGCEHPHDDAGHDHSAHSAHSGIATYVFEIALPVSWTGYDLWVRRLKTLPGEKLLRMKGVLAFAPRGTPTFVQSVQHMFSAPEPIAAWPWPDRTGRLVFIVRGIDRATLEQSLDSLHEAGDTPRPLTPADELGS